MIPAIFIGFFGLIVWYAREKFKPRYLVQPKKAAVKQQTPPAPAGAGGATTPVVNAQTPSLPKNWRERSKDFFPWLWKRIKARGWKEWSLFGLLLTIYAVMSYTWPEEMSFAWRNFWDRIILTHIALFLLYIVFWPGKGEKGHRFLSALLLIIVIGGNAWTVYGWYPLWQDEIEQDMLDHTPYFTADLRSNNPLPPLNTKVWLYARSVLIKKLPQKRAKEAIEIIRKQSNFNQDDIGFDKKGAVIAAGPFRSRHNWHDVGLAGINEVAWEKEIKEQGLNIYETDGQLDMIVYIIKHHHGTRWWKVRDIAEGVVPPETPTTQPTHNSSSAPSASAPNNLAPPTFNFGGAPPPIPPHEVTATELYIRDYWYNKSKIPDDWKPWMMYICWVESRCQQFEPDGVTVLNNKNAKDKFGQPLNKNPVGSVDYGVNGINDYWWFEKLKKECDFSDCDPMTLDGNLHAADFIARKYGLKHWRETATSGVPVTETLMVTRTAPVVADPNSNEGSEPFNVLRKQYCHGGAVEGAILIQVNGSGPWYPDSPTSHIDLGNDTKFLRFRSAGDKPVEVRNYCTY